MIDLTPLEVRKKKGDFRRAMRGYEPALVDDFLELVADRLDELVRENIALAERAARQDQQIADYRERERALTEALVTAQEMREEIRRQSAQEAELAKRTAEQEAKHLRGSAEQEVNQLRAAAQQESAQVRSAAQREAAELKSRVQQEVAEMRASLRQEREREEEALRSLRARQKQFVMMYRSFLEEELNELGGISRALGLATPKAGADAESRASSEAPDRLPVYGAAAGAMGAFAATGLADANAVDAPTAPDSFDEPGAEELEAPEADLPESGAPEPEPFEPEPFEPEPFEPEPFEPEPLEPELLEPEPPGAESIDGASLEAVSFDEGSLEPVSLDEEPVEAEPEGRRRGTGEPETVAGAGNAAGVTEVGDGDVAVPGPIGLGASWESAENWTVEGLELVPEPEPEAEAGLADADAELAEPAHVEGDPEDLDAEVDRLLRNAAAAGYSIDDMDLGDELLLEDVLDDPADGGGRHGTGGPAPDRATPSDNDTDNDADDDGWLPSLLRDDS